MENISSFLHKEKQNLRVVKEDSSVQKQYFRCPYCQDRGIIIQEDMAYQCQCVKQRAVMRKFASANVTPAMAGYTFDQFDLKYYSSQTRAEESGPTFRNLAERALQGAKEFVACYLEEGKGAGILFVGDVGSGKTFLAGCITNALLEQEQQVLFLVVPDFLDDMRATYQKQGEFSEADLMDTARKAKVLILDDLGAHNFTEWTQNKIFSLINYRLNYGLPTVITTNITVEEMGEVVGVRTVSRIIEMCRIFRLHVDEDIRLVMRRER